MTSSPLMLDPISETEKSRRANWLTVMVIVLIGLAGMRMTFFPTLHFDFTRTQTDLGDSRFNNYLLEHLWHWVNGDPRHASLWNMPVCYPIKNTLAYSDLMISFAPPYWLFRWIGVSPLISFSFWAMTLVLLNYLVGCLMLWSVFRFKPTIAAAGAYFLAFGMPALSMLGHHQLVPQFFTFGALSAIVIFFRRESSAGTRRFAMFTYMACVVAQLYGGFYIGYFILLTTAGGLLCALLFRTRKHILATLWSQRNALMAIALLGGILLIPWGIHYSAVAASVGMRSLADTKALLPRLICWGLPTPSSLIYRWMRKLPAARHLPVIKEQAYGWGFLTTLVVGIALYRERRRFSTKLMALLILIVILSMTRFPGGWDLYKLTYQIVPGIKAIRVPERIGLFLAIPVSLGICYTLRNARGPQLRSMWAIVLLCMVEQIQYTGTYDNIDSIQRIDAIGRQVDPHADAFLFIARTPKGDDRDMIYQQLDAMWASMDTGVPTLNFYSGNFPKNWGVFLGADPAPGVSFWMARNRIRPRYIQIIISPESRDTRPDAGDD